MRSGAAIKFDEGLSRALVLHKAAGDPRLRPQSRTDIDAICHATLTSVTAAWNHYVSNVIRDFHVAIANPINVSFHNVASAWSNLAEIALTKFNTPNADNSRVLLINYTGYDPINDWIWPQQAMGGPQVRERLNEILKVRHSFAHGFAIPAYSWTQSASGDIRLTKGAVKVTFSFFRHMVRQTEHGLSGHMMSVHGKTF